MDTWTVADSQRMGSIRWGRTYLVLYYRGPGSEGLFVESSLFPPTSPTPGRVRLRKVLDPCGSRCSGDTRSHRGLQVLPVPTFLEKSRISDLGRG